MEEAWTKIPVFWQGVLSSIKSSREFGFVYACPIYKVYAEVMEVVVTSICVFVLVVVIWSHFSPSLSRAASATAGERKVNPKASPLPSCPKFYFERTFKYLSAAGS